MRERLAFTALISVHEGVHGPKIFLNGDDRIVREEPLGYFAKDVSNDFDMSVSTLRRWSWELEKHGYPFEKNQQGHRIYYAPDYQAIREIKSHLEKDVSLSEAVELVAGKESGGSAAPSSVSQDGREERSRERDMEKFKAMIQEAIQTETERQQRRIEAEKEKETDELKTEIAEMKEKLDKAVDYIQKQEEQEQAKDKQKKTVWQRLFGK